MPVAGRWADLADLADLVSLPVTGAPGSANLVNMSAHFFVRDQAIPQPLEGREVLPLPRGMSA
ncbi:hypothetical protein [Kineosporia sp. NBRC 101731]|uniref:hypothetical protein n=1 Tax=Kineosporia sp. NBRC 101731 TaxID=3032199 RepID=UPI0024A18DEB|nr:hypothetical protein [Kineosporia sp. NBRC 101731]GLY27927.1 hypothetical protein Kisp02_12920 [Kineosporia sp. NBRC 101731]